MPASTHVLFMKDKPAKRQRRSNTPPATRHIKEDSKNSSFWDRFTCCSRKKQEQTMELTEEELALLYGEYEYVIEKLHIVKVPFLYCATEEDIRERLEEIRTREGSIATEKEIPVISITPQYSPIKEKVTDVYYTSHHSQPDFSDVFSTTKYTTKSSESPAPNEPIDATPTEKIVQRPKTMKISLSRATVSSNNYTIIPKERKNKVAKKEKERNTPIYYESTQNTPKFPPRPHYIREDLQEKLQKNEAESQGFTHKGISDEKYDYILRPQAKTLPTISYFVAHSYVAHQNRKYAKGYGIEDPEDDGVSNSSSPYRNRSARRSEGRHSGGRHSGGGQSGERHSGGGQSGERHSGGGQSGERQSEGRHSGGGQSGEQQPEGRQSAGRHSEGRHSEGRHSEGRHSEGPHSEIRHSERQHSVIQPSNVRHSEGQHSVGRDSEGRYSMGQHPEVQDSEVRQPEGRQSGRPQSGGRQTEGRPHPSPRTVTIEPTNQRPSPIPQVHTTNHVPIYQRSELPSPSQPSTSRGPTPSAPPYPSKNQQNIPKGGLTQIETVKFDEETSSTSTEKFPFSAKSSIKSMALSKETDILDEESKCPSPEDTSQKKIYVDVSSKSIVKKDVHSILNKYSSIFIDNIKDPIPKDPIALNEAETNQRQESRHETREQGPSTSRAATVLGQRTTVTEKAGYQFVQVPSSALPPQLASSFRNPRPSTVSKPPVAGNSGSSNSSTEREEASPYETPTVGNLGVNENKRSSQRKNSQSRQERDVQDVYGPIQTQMDQLSLSSRNEPSRIWNKRGPSSTVQYTPDDDDSVEIGAIELTPDSETSSTVSSNQDKHKRWSQPKTYHLQSGHANPFQTTATTKSPDRKPITPVHGHGYGFVNKETGTARDQPQASTSPSKEPNLQNHGQVSPKSNIDASDSKDSGVVKRWKIIIKHHKSSESEDSKASRDPTNRNPTNRKE